MPLEAMLDHAARAAEARGHHWEVRVERGVRTTLVLQNGAVADARQVATEGLGARVVARGCGGYRFTNRLAPEAAVEAVAQAAATAEAHARAAGPLPAPAPAGAGKLRFRSRARRWPRDAPLEERLAMLRRAHQAAKDRLGREGTVLCQWGDWQAQRRVRSADGADAAAELVLSSMQVVVSVREGGEVRGDNASVGGALGLEAYEGASSPEALGQLAAERALDAARARKAPAGATRALVDPALGGILAHESFGHLTEGDVARSGYSLLKGRLGERLGSEHATVVDEGLAAPGEGVEVPFDDEGVAARRVVVLERGVLRSWLHSRGTAALEGATPTGNARAVDIRYPPICRMRNTSFAPGSLSFEEALEQLGDGVYACESLGGMPRSDGTFLFHAQRGWRVERGEVKEPLKGVSLSGHILSFLQNIEGATRERKLDSFFFGGCGKWDQNGLAVGFGGPHLVLREVFMGGEAA